MHLPFKKQSPMAAEYEKDRQAGVMSQKWAQSSAVYWPPDFQPSAMPSPSSSTTRSVTE